MMTIDLPDIAHCAGCGRGDQPKEMVVIPARHDQQKTACYCRRCALVRLDDDYRPPSADDLDALIMTAVRDGSHSPTDIVRLVRWMAAYQIPIGDIERHLEQLTAERWLSRESRYFIGERTTQMHALVFEGLTAALEQNTTGKETTTGSTYAH